MNYYQDSRNDYYATNNQNNYDYNKNDYGHDENRTCCVRRVEETYLCFPSYYNEEKDDKKEEKKERCFEGTFRICPKCENQEKKNNDDHSKNEQRFDCRCHQRCGFCGLFRRW